ncbi:MAG: winged helix-turn-helix domain-containing protein [Thermoproteota archaeon]
MIKNRRRVKLAQILLEGPLDTRELQRRLKREGYYHSMDTIRRHYAGSMLKAGILSEADGTYRLTDDGRRVICSLGDLDLEVLFPPSSKCYEEMCLLALEEPKKYSELLTYMPNVDLQRTIRRLRIKGLVEKLKPDRHVTYHVTENKTDAPSSETERRILRSIPDDGLGVTEISRKVGISVRRTFKYLKRLREKGLVSSSTDLTMLSLTEEGRRIAEKLRQILGIAGIRYLKTHSNLEDAKRMHKVSFEEKEASEHSFELSKERAAPISVQSRFTTKRDMREKLLYELVLNSGDDGVIQANIGMLLHLPSREISRIVSRLESWKLIRKDRVLFNGRNTFRIVFTRKLPSLKSILGAPCITCVNANRCDEGNVFGGISPQECSLLERWIMNVDTDPRIDKDTSNSDDRSSIH